MTQFEYNLIIIIANIERWFKKYFVRCKCNNPPMIGQGCCARCGKYYYK